MSKVLARAASVAAVAVMLVGTPPAAGAGDISAPNELKIAQATGSSGRSSGKTGKGAQHAPPIHCQWINGQKVCGSPGGTGPQTPTGPNFQRPLSDDDRTNLGSERCKPYPWTGSRLIANARELAQTVYKGYDRDPILIARITNKLFRGQTRLAFLVALSGTEPLNVGQATWFSQDLRAGFNLRASRFRQNVWKALLAYRDGQGVPPGTFLVLAGHSLGGMVAQNLAADPDVARFWRPLRVVTFGSPKTIDDPSWTRITRFGAYLLTPHRRSHIDFVTTLTPRGDSAGAQIWFDSGIRAVEGLRRRIAIGEMLALHSSYPKAEALTRYDAFGQKIGIIEKAQTLILDPQSVEYCISPAVQ